MCKTVKCKENMTQIEEMTNDINSAMPQQSCMYSFNTGQKHLRKTSRLSNITRAHIFIKMFEVYIKN